MSVRSASASAAPAPKGEVAVYKIWWVGPLAIVAAIVANLVARGIVLALVDVPAEFPPLQSPTIVFFTTIGVGLGALVFALIGRRAKRPIRTFRIVALVALVVSILPNLSLMANPAGAPFPGATSQGFGLLIVFHVVAAVAAVATLTTLARR